MTVPALSQQNACHLIPVPWLIAVSFSPEVLGHLLGNGDFFLEPSTKRRYHDQKLDQQLAYRREHKPYRPTGGIGLIEHLMVGQNEENVTVVDENIPLHKRDV